MEILSKDSIALREPILGGGILLHSKGNVVGDNVERKGLLLHFGLETGAGHFSYIEVAADFEIVGFKLFDALHHLLQLNKLLVLNLQTEDFFGFDRVTIAIFHLRDGQAALQANGDLLQGGIGVSIAFQMQVGL